MTQLTEEQERLYTLRNEAKKQKDFRESDRLRNELETQGIDVVRLDNERRGPVKEK